MNKTWNNKAWFMVLPVLLLVAFNAVIPLMTVVNYSVQEYASDVVYRKVPVGFSARHQVAQKAFYALEEMGQLDAMHKRVFAAIHVQRQRLMTEKAYVDFVAAQGLDAARFESLLKSFSVATKANRARQLSEAYRIDGTPALGVGGRYYTSGTLAGGLQAMLAVADHLIMLTRRGA